MAQGGSGSAGGPESWVSEHAARWAELIEESIRTGAASAQRWGERSLEEGEWTVDTVTADVIADWEELTPLAGRWLDLWLEAVQQGMKAARRAG